MKPLGAELGRFGNTQAMGPVEIVAYMAAHAVGFLRCYSNRAPAHILRLVKRLSINHRSVIIAHVS